MDINDIKHLAVERIFLVPDSSEGVRGYLWCDDPAPSQGMDPAEAVEYVRKDVHDARIAELEADCAAHKAAEEVQIALRQKADERGAALAAHVEQLNYVIVDAKRCAAVLAFPSNYNAADYQSFAKDVMSNIEALSKQNPIASSDNCDLECGAYSTYCKCKAEAQQ